MESFWGETNLCRIFFYCFCLYIYVLTLEIQLSRGECWHSINRFYPASFVSLSQTRTWISHNMHNMWTQILLFQRDVVVLHFSSQTFYKVYFFLYNNSLQIITITSASWCATIYILQDLIRMVCSILTTDKSLVFDLSIMLVLFVLLTYVNGI